MGLLLIFVGILRTSFPKMGSFGGRGGVMFTPNEVVLTLGGFYVCANFGENPSGLPLLGRDSSPSLTFCL